MKRREFIILLGAAAAWPLAARAQQPSKIRQIGFLAPRPLSTPSKPDAYYDAFVQKMKDLGYIEGKNLHIEWRSAEGNYERLPALAAELVNANPEVIVTDGTPPVEALRRATSTIPIVTAAVGDPVKSGFAASLARPGGNITGLSLITTDLGPKYFELLSMVVPNVSRIAFLMNPGTSVHLTILKGVEAGAERSGAKVLRVDARTMDEVEQGFTLMQREGVQALIVAPDAFFLGQRPHLPQLTIKHQFPALFCYREDAQAGGLISYGQDLADFFRVAATYVDKILKGASPAELPFEQPTKIHLAVNRKTAAALGLTVPPALLVRADEVIE